jgi:CheY-like chemotaxis protein
MPGEKKNILIIDDQPDERVYLAVLLADNGYITAMAENGNDGLEKAEANPPDLITLDITMPEKSGVKFYREIRKHPELCDIPVVVVTGVTGLGGNPDEFRRFLSSRKNVPPPDGFISKPVEQEKLLAVIRELVE